MVGNKFIKVAAKSPRKVVEHSLDFDPMTPAHLLDDRQIVQATAFFMDAQERANGSYRRGGNRKANPFLRVDQRGHK